MVKFWRSIFVGVPDHVRIELIDMLFQTRVPLSIAGFTLAIVSCHVAISSAKSMVLRVECSRSDRHDLPRGHRGRLSSQQRSTQLHNRRGRAMGAALRVEQLRLCRVDRNTRRSNFLGEESCSSTPGNRAGVRLCGRHRLSDFRPAGDRIACLDAGRLADGVPRRSPASIAIWLSMR